MSRQEVPPTSCIDTKPLIQQHDPVCLNTAVYSVLNHKHCLTEYVQQLSKDLRTFFVWKVLLYSTGFVKLPLRLCFSCVIFESKIHFFSSINFKIILKYGTVRDKMFQHLLSPHWAFVTGLIVSSQPCSNSRTNSSITIVSHLGGSDVGCERHIYDPFLQQYPF